MGLISRLVFSKISHVKLLSNAKIAEIILQMLEGTSKNSIIEMEISAIPSSCNLNYLENTKLEIIVKERKIKFLFIHQKYPEQFVREEEFRLYNQIRAYRSFYKAYEDENSAVSRGRLKSEGHDFRIHANNEDEEPTGASVKPMKMRISPSQEVD